VTPAVSSEVPLAGYAPRRSAAAQASGRFACEHDLHELANSIASIQGGNLSLPHEVRAYTRIGLGPPGHLTNQPDSGPGPGPGDGAKLSFRNNHLTKPPPWTGPAREPYQAPVRQMVGDVGIGR
jgi:hypothetical protein